MMVGRFISTYGFDPSLGHGALVRTTSNFSADRQCLALGTLAYRWHSKSEFALTEKSTPDQVYRLVDQIVASIPISSLPRAIAIDYDPRAVYWTRKPAQVALLHFMTGYFIRAAHTLGIPTVMVSPDKIRTFLKLPKKTHKDVVWEAFLQQVTITGVSDEVINLEDGRDAVMLAYFVAATIYQEQPHVTRVTTTPLSRRRA